MLFSFCCCSKTVRSDSSRPHGLQHARLPSHSITISWSLLKLMSVELMMTSNHLILCHPLFFCPQSFPASESFPTSQLFASVCHLKEKHLPSSQLFCLILRISLWDRQVWKGNPKGNCHVVLAILSKQVHRYQWISDKGDLHFISLSHRT